MRLRVRGRQIRALCFCYQSILAPCFKRMYLAFSVCLQPCLEQNSRSGGCPFCWSFCLWDSKIWNHLRDQSSTYGHEVSSASPVVLCQVAEMVRMETRAVSREFSDSKARAFAVTEYACHYVLHVVSRRFGWLICSS